MSNASYTPAGLSLSSVSFGYTAKAVLNDVSLSIAPRSFTGIVGANGCGKTTLARILAGKLTPTSGSVLSDGIPLPLGHVGSTWFISSDPEMQFVTGTVLDEVAFALQARGMAVAEILPACRLALAAVQLTEVEDIHPFFLSTGEQFRLLLAVALIQQPRFLLLDEVTSMMDGYTRRDILALLAEHRRHFGLAVALFTHRLEDLLYADTIAVVCEGRVVMRGAVREVLTAVQGHPEWGIEPPLAYRFAQWRAAEAIPA